MSITNSQSSVISQAHLMQHRIKTGEARPVRMPQYRLPHAYRELVDKVLQEMEEGGIIETSASNTSNVGGLSDVYISPEKMVIHESYMEVLFSKSFQCFLLSSRL